MRSVFACLIAGGFSLASAAIAEQGDKPRSASLSAATLRERMQGNRAQVRPIADSLNSAPDRAAATTTVTTGRPENRWRYRFFRGRWWYWTPDNRWSYFNGSRWTPYRSSDRFMAQKVDPALLRLEAKEGPLGYKRWTQGGGAGPAAALGGGGWSVSGTRGSIGGDPSGAFTISPGMPRSLNTNGPRAGARPPARAGR
jgi:hypothetical protein